MTAPTPRFVARTERAACPVRHRAVCARCEEGELARLDAIESHRSWRAGETVLFEGHEMDFAASVVAASVVAGFAVLTRSLEDGRAQMVGLLMPSNFPERPDRRTAPHEVAAATDPTPCMFRRAPFEALLVEIPHIRERLLEMTLDELDAARGWMLLRGRKTARERVARLPLMFARRSAVGGGPVRAVAPITREAMASHLGLAIETVSRRVTGLRRDGVIALEGLRGIVGPRLDALANAAGEGPGATGRPDLT